MFCPKCKSKNSDGANFCQNCGTALAKKESQNVEHTSNKTVEPRLSKTNSYVILSIAFVFALIIIFAIYENNRSILESKIMQSSSGRQQAVQENQSPQAQAMMQKVVDLKNALEADPENYDLNLQMANSNFDIGRFKEAIKYYRKARALKGNDPNVIIDMGVSYFNLSQMDSALVFMKRALEIDPVHPQGLYNVGIVYYNLGNFEKALQSWEQLIRLHSESREAQSAKQFVEQLKNQTGKS